MLLRTFNGRFVLTEAHLPFEMKGAIFCWPQDLPDGTPGKVIRSTDGRTFPYRWTLTSPELMGYAREFGVNTHVVRLGPYRRDKLCCGLEEIGPPILEDGIYNPKFDAYLLELAHDAGRHDNLLIVSLDDSGWGGKHQRAGDDVGYALNPNDVMDARRVAYLKHFVELLDGFGNVAFEIGNENDLNPTWTPDFERANYALIRATEKLVVHVVISNTRDYTGPYEAMASHSRGSVDSPINGKPVMVNEYNPRMSPAEFASCYTEMRARGGACLYWRSDGTDAEQDATLAVLKAGGSGGLEPIEYPLPSSGPAPPRDGALSGIRHEFSRGSTDLTPCVGIGCGKGDIGGSGFAYCNSIGMGYMGGVPRGWCPVRNECGPTGKPVPGDPASFECDLRADWERWLLRAPHPICTSDGAVTYIDSGFRVATSGTWLDCCDATGTICTGRFRP